MFQIKILLAQVGSLKNNNLDEQSLQEVIIEIVTSALRNTNIDFNLNGYTGCPRFVRRPVSPSQHLPLHYDSMVRIRILYRFLQSHIHIFAIFCFSPLANRHKPNRFRFECKKKKRKKIIHSIRCFRKSCKNTSQTYRLLKIDI